eukprot:GEMP01006947.1.p1 GENE.GEMP01006947.1~~GEMP01006947.1.p1  ORF type:complete len:1073 (-),score=198.73 GEMP01006947.1:270-3488(-)
MDSAVTGKSFEKGPEFCFKDLLDLGQYHFADAVSEIVDQSAKESKIEKKLNVIRNTWSKMSVEFNCAREDCPLLAELGDIVETLEVHPLERMQMTSQGSFIEFCRGASGCSDEFNRISIEVLSVVSTQYKSILDAIRENAKTLFMDVGINLIIPIGTFTSMNSGYAGRTELPESSKALFRSCAMIVPDLSFICESMLMSEGFVKAQPLARKLVTLYSLCKDLLSKEMHYDWGLRAVKSLLRHAGKSKRKEPDADENIVLPRALRDFNVPKLTTYDMPNFLLHIQDLLSSAWPEPIVDIDPTFVRKVARHYNKVLTLVSNERIPFTGTMRMPLETQHIDQASPATVSRGGALFINETGVGWKPFMESWHEQMDLDAQSTFYLLSSNCFPQKIEALRKMIGFSCPILDMSFVQSIYRIIDALLNNNTKEASDALSTMNAEDHKIVYEMYFVCRKRFNRWVKSTSKIKLHDHGHYYDYPFEPITKEWVHRDSWMTDFEPPREAMFQNAVVSSVDIERTKYVLDLHMWRNKPVLFVRIDGTRKTTAVKDFVVANGFSHDNMIKQRVGEEFTCIQLTAANWLSKVVYALNTGGNLRIEAIRSEIDAILEPLLSRAVVQRGRNSFIARIGGEEIDYDPKFQLILQSKLPSPKYRPEIAAHCNRINFIVTQELLEDHILAMIVNSDKPELEQENQVLVRSQHRFKVTQAQLEDDLLAQLACADSSTMLDNFPFIEGLAKPKATSTENFIQVKVALETEIQINTLLELYRPVALGGSMLFFVVIQLVIVEHMYQYLLDSLVSFLMEAIDRAPALDDTNIPTALFIVTIGMTIFRWGNRGLSELRKLIFCALLALHIFMRGLMRLGGENPMANFLPNNACFDAQKLIVLEGFESFADNMKKDSRRCCKEWFNEWTPEESKLPFDWKKLYNFPFHKSLVLRGLWPDRTPTALGDWIRNILPNGTNSMDYDGTSSAFSVVLTSSYDVSNNTTPIFFILSPVVPSWCRELGEQTDGFMIEGSRLDFLCFLRADPSPGIPIGLLERSIKLTNAFHQGLLANLRRLFAMFNKEDFENRDAKNIPTN